MTLPYLQGWGDTLAQNGAQIGQNIAHIVNPQIDQQTALKNAIAKDPTLLQQIANNPGLADTLTKMGYGNIGQQTQGLGVDPGVAAQRQIAQNQAVTTGAESQVAAGTVQPRIQTAATNAEQSKVDLGRSQIASKFEDIKYKNALTEFNARQQALKDFPNVNVQQLGNAIVNGQALPADALSTLDEGGRDALKLYVDSWNKAKERVKDMNVAQLIHHSQGQQERTQNLQLLRGLSVDLRGQLQNAVQFLAKVKPTQFESILAAKEPDKASPMHQQWEEAQATKQQYQEAIGLAAPGSALHKQLEQVDARFALLSGLDSKAFGGESNTPNTPGNDNGQIAKIKQAYLSGTASAANVQELVTKGLITSQQAGEILASKQKAHKLPTVKVN